MEIQETPQIVLDKLVELMTIAKEKGVDDTIITEYYGALKLLLTQTYRKYGDEGVSRATYAKLFGDEGIQLVSRESQIEFAVHYKQQLESLIVEYKITNFYKGMFDDIFTRVLAKIPKNEFALLILLSKSAKDMMRELQEKNLKLAFDCVQNVVSCHNS